MSENTPAFRRFADAIQVFAVLTHLGLFVAVVVLGINFARFDIRLALLADSMDIANKNTGRITALEVKLEMLIDALRQTEIGKLQLNYPSRQSFGGGE